MKRRLMPLEMYPRSLFQMLFQYLSFSIAFSRYTPPSFSRMSLYSGRVCSLLRDSDSRLSSLLFLRKWLRIRAITMMRVCFMMLVCSKRGILSLIRSMAVCTLGFSWRQQSQARNRSATASMILLAFLDYWSRVKARTQRMVMKQNMMSSTQKERDLISTMSLILSWELLLRSISVTLQRSQQFTFSCIIFFSPWICWNTYLRPPWSGWCTLSDQRNVFLKSYNLYSLVRFMFQNAEGYWMFKRTRGVGRRRAGQKGRQQRRLGRKVFTVSKQMMFQIIILLYNSSIVVQHNNSKVNHYKLRPRSGILGELIGWMGGVRMMTLFFFSFF